MFHLIMSLYRPLNVKYKPKTRRELNQWDWGGVSVTTLNFKTIKIKQRPGSLALENAPKNVPYRRNWDHQILKKFRFGAH